ncbi:hypothetical protein [Psittacicella melopsittaci]|uniref:hypothetical protein n=1 Tax=Psittacicella melopsittaci TaxID=2028576 RepID=UPI001CA73E28|nr:hypothetical protein [Psittacicella melopsittaci]
MKIKILAALAATLMLASCVPFWSCNLGNPAGGPGQPGAGQQQPGGGQQQPSAPKR